MAKRKLSEAQRKSLRRDIDSRLSSGTSRAEIVRALALKYRISPISMRWYLRTQPAAGSSLPSEAPLAEGQTTALPGAGFSGSVGGDSSGNGHDQTLVDLLSGLTHQKIKRLMEAKKLLPKLEVHRRHQSELQGQIRQLEKKLETEAVKARGVEAQIKRLAGM